MKNLLRFGPQWPHSCYRPGEDHFHLELSVNRSIHDTRIITPLGAGVLNLVLSPLTLSYWSLEVQHGTSWQITL